MRISDSKLWTGRKSTVHVRPGVDDVTVCENELLISAQAAGRGARRKRNSASPAAGGESVVSEFLKSAQAAGRGARRKRNSASPAAGGESVVREFLKSAQAAGRGARRKRNSASPA